VKVIVSLLILTLLGTSVVYRHLADRAFERMRHLEAHLGQMDHVLAERQALLEVIQDELYACINGEQI